MKEVLKPYVPVCQAIATLLQPHAEVVLHDLATGNIAYIANAFSKRRPGDSSMTDLDVAISIDSSVIGPYRKTNWDRRQLRSVTAVLRDRQRALGRASLRQPRYFGLRRRGRIYPEPDPVLASVRPAGCAVQERLEGSRQRDDRRLSARKTAHRSRSQQRRSQLNSSASSIARASSRSGMRRLTSRRFSGCRGQRSTST